MKKFLIVVILSLMVLLYLNRDKVIENDEKIYDRLEWTSDYQSYECDNKGHDHDSNEYTGDDGGKFHSIRAYAFYESEWYDWNGLSYTDPYTGNHISDVKDTDYDHIIPLAYAHNHGGSSWSPEKKKRFADDPSNGVCVNRHDNRAKGAKGPSEWMPERNQKWYCEQWLRIAKEWNLEIEEADMRTINGILGR